eukprot:gene38762-47126_t
MAGAAVKLFVNAMAMRNSTAGCWEPTAAGSVPDDNHDSHDNSELPQRQSHSSPLEIAAYSSEPILDQSVLQSIANLTLFFSMQFDAVNKRLDATNERLDRLEASFNDRMTHFVLYKNRMLGISVTHMPCYVGDLVPSFIRPCSHLDVGLWIGCPPDSVSLLNISSRIANARLGDTATIFGTHYRRSTLETGAQEAGMSGGAAINGIGMYKV